LTAPGPTLKTRKAQQHPMSRNAADTKRDRRQPCVGGFCCTPDGKRQASDSRESFSSQNCATMLRNSRFIRFRTDDRSADRRSRRVI